MKKSELKSSIREEIIDILEAVTDKDVKAQKDYNDELERSAELAKKAGLVDEGDNQDDGYVDKKDVDDTTDLYVHSDPESMAFENKENDEEEPSTSQLKGASKDSVSVIASKLQQISTELKKTAKKWKESEGGDKLKLRDRLVKLTKIKKELESML
jgi:hypothetical protein